MWAVRIFGWASGFSRRFRYGNVKLTPEQQAAFVEEMPEVFLGWGRTGMTHVRLAAASVDLLRGALQRRGSYP